MVPVAQACNVDMQVTNGSTQDITIVQVIPQIKHTLFSRVIGLENKTVKGRSSPVTFMVGSDLGCNSKRNYRVILKKGASTQTVYYPSMTTYTETSSFSLGDLNDFFP